MRHLIIYIAALATLLATSCEQDTYDKGEGKYSNMMADFVEAHANAEKKIDYVITDNGDSLVLAAPLELAWAKTADSTYRAALYYNKEGATTIKVMAIEQMLTLRLMPKDSIAAMKTDPVGFESAWTSKNGRYINIALTLKVVTISETSKKHRINLIPDSIVENEAMHSRTLHATLYHDKGDIPEYYTQKYYFTLPSSTLSAFNTDSIAININTTDNGTRTLTFAGKP